MSCQQPQDGGRPPRAGGPPPEPAPRDRLVTTGQEPARPGRPDDPGLLVLSRCRAAIASCPVPHAWTMDRLLRQLEALRGRHLIVITTALSTACRALRLSADAADYILISQDTAPGCQQRAILHQIGHMVLGHRGFPAVSTISLLFPYLDPDMVATLISAPSSCTAATAEERDAEAFASLMDDIIRSSA